MCPVRRSRSVVGLFAAALLVVAAGCGSEAPGGAREPVSTWAPAVPAALRMVSATVAEIDGPDDAQLDDLGDVPMTDWLVPWRDGFLALAVLHPAPALPDELPPELAALFPPEVAELFPDGLPATQAEAAGILEEAGLLDVVMDIIDEHPELLDVIPLDTPPAPVLAGMWTADGDEWVTVDITTPDDLGAFTQLSAADDRITIAGAVQPVGEGGTWTATVASTTDLQNWSTVSFPVDRPEGIADDDTYFVNPVTVAADDEHWVLRVMPDPAFAPPSNGDGPQPELWSGTWDGDTTLVDTGADSWFLEPTSAGFLDLGPAIRFSPDGQAWEDGAALGPNVVVQAVASVDDGVVAITTTPFADSSIIVLDPAGRTVTEVEIPELGEGFFALGEQSSPAFLVESVPPDPFAQPIVVEHDGYELTQRFGELVAYRLVDLATGDVVAEESVDLRTTPLGGGSPFEYLEEDEVGVTILDPDTDEAIVEIPHRVIGAAWQSAQRAAESVAVEPGLWLVATTDGETWLVDELDPELGLDFGWAAAVSGPVAAINGRTVLVGPSGWDPPGAKSWYRYTIED